MATHQIKFGTSGWRAILCEEFTFDNVRVVAQAIADHLKEAPATNEIGGVPGAEPGSVLIGYDNRFMGATFARVACEVLAANTIPARLTDRSAPTPVLSFDVLRHGRAGAINFTASHNPPEYNGLKFSPAWGGPALPETTSDIENRANGGLDSGYYLCIDFDEARDKGLVAVHDPRPDYLARIRELVDLDCIRAAGLHVAVDLLYGTAAGYLDELLTEAGATITVIHDNPDPMFGGRPPEPSREHIPELIGMVARDSALHLGLSCDGDADRFGIVDRGGEFLEPNYFLALLFDYLVRERDFPGGVARSVATSHLLDAVARDLGREVHETPVGFKFIGKLIARGEVALGGEESAGLSIHGHVPEKDGILACLLAAEMVARRGKPLMVQLEELYDRVGRVETRRQNFRITAAQEAALSDRLADIPAEIAGSKVARVVTMDGVKLIMEDGRWLLVRKSGTEPVVRLYGEASAPERLDQVMSAGERWLLG